jgi:hypothetical protein
MAEKCPNCKVKLVGQWQQRGKKTRVLMLVCPNKCGFEKFPTPSWPRTVPKI